MEGKEVTIGEQRVRVQFNPSASGYVDDIKQSTARLINICEGMKNDDPRLAALAMTAFEEAAMWAVKLATAGLPPANSGAQAGGVMPTPTNAVGPKSA